MNYIVYTWGDGQILNYVFNAVATIFNSGNLTNAAYAILIIVFSYHLLKHGLEHNLFTLMTKLLVASAAFFSFFSVKEQVTVEDLGTGNTYVIANVPFIPALWGAMFSKIEYDLATLFDNAYTSATGAPGSATYSQSGYIFWQTLYADLPKLRQVAETMPYLAYTYDEFVRNCVLPSMVQGRITVNNLIQEIPSIAFQNVNPALSTNYMTPSGQVQTDTCNNIYNTLFGSSGYFTKFQNSNLDSMIRGTMFPSYNLSQVSNLLNNTSTVTQYFTGISADINQLATTALATDMFADSLLSTSATDASMASYISTMTLIKQIQERSTIAELGKRWIPVIHQIVEAFFYGIMPIFALMLLTPMAKKILLSIIEFGLWLSFWGPLFAILNMLVNIYSQRNFQVYTGSANYQLSAYAIAGIVHGANDISSLAASLSWAVPTIAFALATGSTYAFAQIPGMIQGIVSGIGSGVATQMANPESLASNSVAKSSQLATFSGSSVFNPNVYKSMFSADLESSALSTANTLGSYSAADMLGGASTVSRTSKANTASNIAKTQGQLKATGNSVSNLANQTKRLSASQMAKDINYLNSVEQALEELTGKPMNSLQVGEELGRLAGLPTAMGALENNAYTMNAIETLEKMGVSPTQAAQALAEGKPISALVNGEQKTVYSQNGNIVTGSGVQSVSQSFSYKGLKGSIVGQERTILGKNGKPLLKTIQGTGTFGGYTGAMTVIESPSGKVLGVSLSNKYNIDALNQKSEGTYNNIMNFTQRKFGQETVRENLDKGVYGRILQEFALTQIESGYINQQYNLTQVRSGIDIERYNVNMENIGFGYNMMNPTGLLASLLSGNISPQEAQAIDELLQQGQEGQIPLAAALTQAMGSMANFTQGVGRSNQYDIGTSFHNKNSNTTEHINSHSTNAGYNANVDAGFGVGGSGGSSGGGGEGGGGGRSPMRLNIGGGVSGGQRWSSTTTNSYSESKGMDSRHGEVKKAEVHDTRNINTVMFKMYNAASKSPNAKVFQKKVRNFVNDLMKEASTIQNGAQENNLNALKVYFYYPKNR